MPESEFDKQVQQEMEGLRLRPSAAVWENVEKELRRKKRRRYIVFFWLLAGLGLLGYSGYFLTQKGKPTLAESSSTPADHSGKTVQQPAQSIPAAPSTTNPTDNTTPVDQTIQLKENTTITATQPAAADVEELSNNQKIAAAASVKNNGVGRKRNSGSKDQPSEDNGRRLFPETGKRKNDQAGSPVAESGISKETNTPETKGSESKSADIATQTSPVIPQDSVTAKADSAVAAIPPPPAEAKAPVVKKQSSSKIRWSLDLAVGGSGPINSPFLIGDPNKSNRVSYDQNGMYTPSPGNPIVTPPVNYGVPTYYPRSDIKPGPAFRIGILGEWAISKRSSIVSGLQYQYQSNNIRTGYYMDTTLVFNNNASQQVAVRSLYQGMQQKTFTNRYHYLQIPVTFQWQVNKGKKMPVLLNAGLSAGYLLTTNALVYDPLQGGIYYHDKSAFNRFMFNFNTGLAFRFGNNKALQWSIGPEVSMGLRSQVKEGYDKKQYPLYLGIQARLYWPKKSR